jgi:hypothetical protein
MREIPPPASAEASRCRAGLNPPLGKGEFLVVSKTHPAGRDGIVKLCSWNDD